MTPLFGLLDSPAKGLYVGLAFTVIQQTEGHLLIPLLMKGSLSIPPVLTLLTQALMATVFGLLGLLIAVPMLSAVMAAVKMLYVVDVVGDEITLNNPSVHGLSSSRSCVTIWCIRYFSVPRGISSTLAISSVVAPGRTRSIALSSHSRHCLYASSCDGVTPPTLNVR